MASKKELNTENVHTLISLSAALQYKLQQAEDIRREIGKISLKVKQEYKKTK